MNSFNFLGKHHLIYHDSFELFIIEDILSLKKESLHFIMDTRNFLVKLIMNFRLINYFHLLKIDQSKLCLFDSSLHLNFQLYFHLDLKVKDNYILYHFSLHLFSKLTIHLNIGFYQ